MTTPPLLLYRGVAATLGPALGSWLLRRRAARGKEDPARLPERLGYPSAPRPEGPLVWLHAASVGESLSLLPLIDALRRERADLALLVTTGTVTSARIMAARLPDGVIHQFAPIDTPPAMRRFLAHWRPDLLGVTESELWPTMLLEARRAGAATALLSARMSERSAARWAKAPRSIGALLGGFDAITAQDEAVAARLNRLGARPSALCVCGSLKHAAGPLPADEEELAAWRARLGARPRWLAASTHAGEEAAVFDAHRRLASRIPGLLTIIAPRHPERGEDVAVAASAAGLSATRRSLDERPTAGGAGGESEIHIVDALGELGLWFRLCPVSFIGGSLVPVGGHNPLEPARLGSAALTGPHVANMEGECARLEAAGALLRVADAEDLGPALERLLEAPSGAPNAEARRMQEAGLGATAEDGGVAARHLAALTPLLPAPRAAERRARDHAAA